MAGSPSTADWITAAMTTITGIATAATGVVAWLSFRREAQKDIPITECDAYWTKEGFVQFHLLIRNTLPESVVVSRACVKKPAGSKIGKERERGKDGGIGCVVMPQDHDIALKWSLAPCGVTGNSCISGSSSICPLDLFILPPSAWKSGEVVVEIYISRKSSNVRSKRIAIKRVISAPVIEKNADKVEALT